MAVTNTFERDTLVSDFSMVLERSLSPYGDKSIRVPFYLTSSYRQANGIPGVSMLMNPSSVHFVQAKRTTRRDTQAGSVFYHWTNKDGRNNDILNLEFTGQTGNIGVNFGTVNNGASEALGYLWNKVTGEKAQAVDEINNIAAENRNVSSTQLAVALKGSGYSVSGAARLSNFYNLYSLTREPMIDPYTKVPIQYFISYSSPAFANTFVTFIGHFNNVLDFTDDATSPFNVRYSFGFTVLSSMPSMDAIYTTVSSNLSSVFMNPLG